MIEFVQHLINGLSLGAIYALIALGYTMVFGVLKLINFAHGEVYMCGAFMAFYTAQALGLAERPGVVALLAVLVVAMAGCALMGFAIERLAYRPLRQSPRINVLITAVGVSMLLQNSGQLFFGADPKFFPQVYQSQGAWAFGELKVNPIQVVVLLIAISLMLGLQYLVFKTRWGRAMRAVSFDSDTANLVGIPTDRVISYTFMLGSALAGAAGVLVGLVYPKIDPLMGVLPGLKAFIAAVFGGIGNIAGAVLGSLVLGLSEEFVVGYVASSFRDAIAFSILIVVLLFRPAGLLGSNVKEKV